MSTTTTTYRKLQVFAKTRDFAAATKVVEVPLREPTPNQIRIKQLYAGVNAKDINVTAARNSPDVKLPFDIGFEAIGVIDALGDEVKASGKFQIGQSVLVFDRAQSQGFAEYSYKTADAVVPIPSAKPEFLVTLVNGLTASIGLDQAGYVKAGDKVLITAAAGGTGQIAVQWAKKRGAYVIGLTSSDEKAAYLRKIGADDVINYRTEDLDTVLSKKHPDGVDVIWETIGGETFQKLFEHLAPRGRLVIIGSIQSYKKDGFTSTPIENLNFKLRRGSKSLTGFILYSYVDLIPEYLPQLIGGISEGKIVAQVDLGERSDGGKFYGIDQVYRAEEWLHSGKNVGKVVVQLQ